MPKPARERGIANYDDEEESEEEDIDASILDHAPNWANGLEADKRDGLRVMERSSAKSVEKKKSDARLVDTGEECKLVLVVRTDLGMTKGVYFVLFNFVRFYFILTYLHYPLQLDLTTIPYRENCRTMLTRNPRLL